MADKKITELTELAEAPADDDLSVLVDVSDTTMAASGTNKKITDTNLTSRFPLLAGRDGDTLSIDEVRAYDGAGLKLYDDGGNGIFVADGGAITTNGILTTSKAIDVTIANAGNDVGLTVTQNDVTNNPVGATITNAGTGNGLFIDQNGNGIALNIDSESTTVDAVDINAAALTTGRALYIHNSSTAWTGTTGLTDITIDHPDSTGSALYLRNDGDGPNLKFNQGKDVEVIDFDACTDGGTTHTTLAGSIKVQMPNGSTGYINLYT